MVLVLSELDYPMSMGMDIRQKQGLKLAINDRPVYLSANKHSISAAEFTELEDQEKAVLEEIIRREKERSEGVKDPTQLVEYEIRLLNPRSIKQRYRPRNPAMQKVINDHIDEMLEAEVIELSLK
jgi:hypothetical protein